MNTCMLLAGGRGERLGAGTPKQFVEVLGKPVLAYTAELFEENPAIDEIGIVCHADWMGYCEEMAERYGLSKVRWIVPGGDSFLNSIANGVRRMEEQLAAGAAGPDDVVLIHIGVSPFTSRKIVDAVLEAAAEHGGAFTGTPCYYSLGARDPDGAYTPVPAWNRYVLYNSPWGYRLSYLIELLAQLRQQEGRELAGLDPSSLVRLARARGEAFHCAYGDQTNIKITTAEDLRLFEGWLLAQQRREGP